MTAFDPVAQCQRYFDAWRRRDAGAVLATFAAAGTYEDPITGGPIAGDALRAYAQGLWAAFPDLDFELAGVHRVGEREVHAQWRMTGRNTGPFNGLPPTGRAVNVPGIDLMELAPDGVRRVTGLFDSAAVPRQLGLDVIVQPATLGPFAFGASTVMRRPVPARPGVLAFTELLAADDGHVQRIREMGRAIVLENLDNPALQAFTSQLTGRRLTTISAWRTHGELSAAMRTGTHAESIRAFFNDGIVAGGHTGVYAPVRVGPWFSRCAACGTLARLPEPQGRCEACGAEVGAVA